MRRGAPASTGAAVAMGADGAADADATDAGGETRGFSELDPLGRATFETGRSDAEGGDDGGGDADSRAGIVSTRIDGAAGTLCAAVAEDAVLAMGALVPSHA